LFCGENVQKRIKKHPNNVEVSDYWHSVPDAA
jgi:hypothetical protein